MSEDLKSGQQAQIVVHGQEGEDLFGEIVTIVGKNAENPNLYDALLLGDTTTIQVFAYEVAKV